MTATRRKLITINGGLGVFLTLLVVVLDHLGHLAAFENWFHHRRALDCQYFVRPPSDKIVFLDIDDRAINTIGRWPWDRNVMAALLDEVAAVKPQLVFLDIIYSEPSKDLEHDQRLAEAIARGGNVLVPLSTPDVRLEQDSPTQVAAREILTRDLELTPAEVFRELAGRGLGVPADDQRSVSMFLSARRAAMFRRIEREMAQKPVTSAAELRPRLLPRTEHINSPLIRLLVQQYEGAEKLQPLRRFTRPTDPNFPWLLRTDEENENAPLAMFGEHAASTGFVDYIADPDGVVRRIALLESHRDRVLPQVGLVIACKLLGADPNAVKADRHNLTIFLPGGETRMVPVSTRPHTETGKPIGALMEIPFVGGTDWKSAFDPHRKHVANHVPMNLVYQIIQTKDDILINNSAADQAITDCEEFAPDFVAEFKSKEHEKADYEVRLKALGKLLEDIDRYLKDYENVPDADLTEIERKQKPALAAQRVAIAPIVTNTRSLVAQLAAQRGDLAKRLSGKAVLIGSVASSAHDLKPTPLHDACPGVVIHGFIANGILSGELWRSAAPWVTRVITLVVGLTTTVLVLTLTPWKAAIAAIGLIAAYFAINGIVVFDYFNTIVGVAGPVVAMGLTWSSCQLVEVLVEKAERRRITSRFASYADPALVEWVVEHPQQAAMTGETREMTVVFTDLAGFTTLNEQLKEKIVPLLNEYLGIMARIVKEHGGYVNKFLGDGIMFFYNAPKPNPNHATDAATTVLKMQRAVDDFNQSLARRGLAPIAMRAGMVTGDMVVGDAGSPDRSDYTVLGDNVNLASRLEGANKATGTKTLMSMRTAELLGERFIWRPVAKLQVKGKTEGVITCELIASAADATPEQKRLAQCSKAVFDCFVEGRFDRCLDAVRCMEEACGPSQLAQVYRELSTQYVTAPPINGFDGSIVLTEK